MILNTDKEKFDFSRIDIKNKTILKLIYSFRVLITPIYMYMCNKKNKQNKKQMSRVLYLVGTTCYYPKSLKL